MHGTDAVKRRSSSKQLIGHCRDITENKETENMIRASEMFTRSILDSLPAHIAVINKDGVIVSVNQAWENFAAQNCLEEKLELTGIGQNYLNVCEKAQAFDAADGNDHRKIMRCFRRQIRRFFRRVSVSFARSRTLVYFAGQRIKRRGGGAVISHINITDRKLAEKELKNSEQFSRSIFENSPDCVKILELDGTLHSMNSQWLVHYGN